MGKYVRTIGEKRFEKPENYACQICRASREICKRCQTADYVVHMEPERGVPTVRRGRPRPSPSVYN